MTALAMLPAGRLAVQAADVAIDPSLEQPAPPVVPGESAENTPEDHEESAWVRPALDLWDGNTSRGSSTGPAIPVITLPGAAGPEAPLLLVRLEAVPQVAGDPAQSFWWDSVHSHAPPASPEL